MAGGGSVVAYTAEDVLLGFLAGLSVQQVAQRARHEAQLNAQQHAPQQAQALLQASQAAQRAEQAQQATTQQASQRAEQAQQATMQRASNDEQLAQQAARGTGSIDNLLDLLLCATDAQPTQQWPELQQELQQTLQQVQQHQQQAQALTTLQAQPWRGSPGVHRGQGRVSRVGGRAYMCHLPWEGAAQAAFRCGASSATVLTAGTCCPACHAVRVGAQQPAATLRQLSIETEMQAVLDASRSPGI
jgi:hypothetical protein